MTPARGKPVAAKAATPRVAETPTRVAAPSQTHQQRRVKQLKRKLAVDRDANDDKSAKRKKSSSKAGEGSKKNGEGARTKSKSATKQPSNTATPKKAQPKVPSGTASNHSNAVSVCLLAPGGLTRRCDQVAAKVNRQIKFKDGEVFSCRNAENADHDCTRAYCKGCFAEIIRKPEEEAVEEEAAAEDAAGKGKKKKGRRARGSPTCTNCDHSNSTAYIPSNKVYVTKGRYNDGSRPLPTHCAGCGGEFV